MWVQPNLLAAHFFILKPIRATACSFFKLKTCGAGQRFFFLFREQKRRRVGRVFLEQKICSDNFICSRNFIQPIFPAIRETDLCSGSKREFFEDSFRVRSSSICLDLRLDLPIILFTIFG